MRGRIEERELLPHPHKPRISQWESALREVKNIAVGKCYVIQPPNLNHSCTVGIERAARCRGMKVKARRRRNEIWIERLA